MTKKEIIARLKWIYFHVPTEKDKDAISEAINIIERAQEQEDMLKEEGYVLPGLWD